MSQAHWNLVEKLAVHLWPVVTLLIGVYVGGYVAGRNQRRYWLIDNKRAEYKELLTTILRNSRRMVALGLIPSATSNSTEGLIDEYEELDREVTQIIDDRIFIARDLTESGTRKKWVEAESALGSRADTAGFTKAVDNILEDIRMSLGKIIG